eukprot:7108935-Prymnesium_polylepis.1
MTPITIVLPLVPIRDGARDDADARLVEADLAGKFFSSRALLRCTACAAGLRCGGCLARRGERAGWA